MSRQMTDRLYLQLSETRSGNARTDVLEELRRLILSGGAPPGTPLPPAELAEVLSVSAIPVREALNTLAGEGLVTHQRNAGYRVSQLSAAELREIYVVRGVLEEAALSRSVDHIDDATLRAARAHHDELLTATRFDDRKAFHDISRRFHQTLISPCGMPRLQNMFEATWNLTEPFQMMRAVPVTIQRELNDDHAGLLDALADRDAAAVLDVARRHHARLETAIGAASADLSLRPES